MKIYITNQQYFFEYFKESYTDKIITKRLHKSLFNKVNFSEVTPIRVEISNVLFTLVKVDNEVYYYEFNSI